ncbi:SH3 domain-containing protein [Jiella avicenniae]|uniref:SH3 domain-containing protein n=1 Tax=Jiella avicenniae TaxID=2907202 RepID=A0A9X1P100_9HYPH|nr:SH3 domain-containing protein [Jiella avicenniae]MCE7029377.1 SH3 domain-containing protein [Jiella avicenniae]
METGDRLSRDADGVDEDGYRQTGGRPSEEAIRGRLIDRRRAFDEAEAGRKLAHRFRQKMRAGGSSVSWSRRALAPAKAVSRGAEALRNRPIGAFVAAASLSAVILVPLALSSYAPLPGEMPLPASPARTHSAGTVEGEQSPPSMSASSSPQSDMEPTATAEVRAPIAPPAPDGSVFETLESEETAASAEPSDRPDTAERTTASTVAPGGTRALPGDDPALFETASLREVAPALPDRQTETDASANPAERPGIDPVAAALALRLPVEPSGTETAVPTTLDPATTGSISPAAAPAGSPQEAATVPGMETAGPAKGFIAVSPSILIASSQDDGPEPVAPTGVVEDAKTADAADEDPATAEAPVSTADGRATASVNLRAEPTNDGKIVAVLSKDEAVKVVSCKGWCEVETSSGAKGYVYEKFIARGTLG